MPMARASRPSSGGAGDRRLGHGWHLGRVAGRTAILPLYRREQITKIDGRKVPGRCSHLIGCLRMIRRAVFASRRGAAGRAPDARRGASAQLVFESVGTARSGWPAPSWRSPTTPRRSTGTPPGWSSGAPLGMTIGWNRFQTGNQHAPPAPGPTRRNATFASVGTWPLGVSYGRLQVDAAGGRRRRARSVVRDARDLPAGRHRAPDARARAWSSGRRSSICADSFATGPSGGPTVEDALDQRHGPRRSLGEDHFDLDVGRDGRPRTAFVSASPCENLLEPHVYEQCRNCNPAAKADASGRCRASRRWPDPCYGRRPGHGRPPGRPSSNDRPGRRRPPGLARRRARRRAVEPATASRRPVGAVGRQSSRSAGLLARRATTPTAASTKTAGSGSRMRAGF